MIDLIEDLSGMKQVYILDTDTYRKTKMEYAVYTVKKLEHIGINKYKVELSTNAFKSSFPKKLYALGFTINFYNSKYMACETMEDAIKEFCYIVRDKMTTNDKLFVSLLKKYPHNFI